MIKLLLAGIIALAAGAAAVFGVPRAYSGVYTASFEHSEFDGCWLTFSSDASKKFYDAVPMGRPDKTQRAQITFIGHSTSRIAKPRLGQGYGHMGAYPCEIKVITLRSARELAVR